MSGIKQISGQVHVTPNRNNDDLKTVSAHGLQCSPKDKYNQSFHSQSQTTTFTMACV